MLQFTLAGLERIAGDVRLLANKEGLTAHAASVDIRVNKQESGIRNQESVAAVPGF